MRHELQFAIFWLIATLSLLALVALVAGIISEWRHRR